MKKNVIIISFIFIFVIGFVFGRFLYLKDRKINDDEKIDNVEIKYHNNTTYYVITGDYVGEYDYQEISLSKYFQDDDVKDKIKLFNTSDILNYNDYAKYCERWNLNQKYQDNNKNYMVVSYAVYGQPIVKARLANVLFHENKISLYMWENTRGVTADISGYFLVVPVETNIYQNEINTLYTKDEYVNIVKYGFKYNPNDLSVDKPIIYLYPTETQEINVKLSNASLITISYPKYHDEWHVIANPDGTLKEINSNRNYYGLYYEGKDHVASIKEEGFIVEGEKVIDFLEEKLALLGLNDREANEFIIYWLPKLEHNKYNYIRFETMDEIEKYMSLEINPTPDSIIRVIMDYKVLDEKIDVIEQTLTPTKRFGYSVVEWGGSEIK